MGDATGEGADGIHLLRVPELGLRAAEGLLGLLSRGDVADGGRHDVALGRSRRAEAHVDGELGAVAAQARRGSRSAPTWIGSDDSTKNALRRALRGGAELRRDQDLDGLSDQVRAFVAEEDLRLVVDEGDGPVRAHDHHPVRRRLEQGPEALLSDLDPLLRLLSFVAKVLLAQLALHRGEQTRHPLLREKVVRAGAQDLDRVVLVERPREDDEGDVGAFCARDRERRQGVELRHPAVGDDHVPRAVLQGRPHGVARLDALEGDPVSAPIELPQQEARVVLRVLDHQQAQGSGVHVPRGLWFSTSQ